MALLAEPKRKNKFSLDPRNTNWSNDDNKFGQRLMEKMGWEKGKGLGANENGMVEHIKASYKSDTRGLGCTSKNADAWIAHQDDFNDLLAALNAENGTTESKDTAAAVEPESDGRKRYYGRFSRGRVQTLRSTEDLDCIFGRRKAASAPASPKAAEHSDVKVKTEVCESLPTVTSSCNIQEYFAMKLKNLKAEPQEVAAPYSAGDYSACGVNEPVKVKVEAGEEMRVPSVYNSVSFSYGVIDSSAVDDIKKFEEVDTKTGLDNENGKGRGLYSDQWSHSVSLQDGNGETVKYVKIEKCKEREDERNGDGPSTVTESEHKRSKKLKKKLKKEKKSDDDYIETKAIEVDTKTKLVNENEKGRGWYSDQWSHSVSLQDGNGETVKYLKIEKCKEEDERNNDSPSTVTESEHKRSKKLKKKLKKEKESDDDCINITETKVIEERHLSKKVKKIKSRKVDDSEQDETLDKKTKKMRENTLKTKRKGSNNPVNGILKSEESDYQDTKADKALNIRKGDAQLGNRERLPPVPAYSLIPKECRSLKKKKSKRTSTLNAEEESNAVILDTIVAKKKKRKLEDKDEVCTDGSEVKKKKKKEENKQEKDVESSAVESFESVSNVGSLLQFEKLTNKESHFAAASKIVSHEKKAIGNKLKKKKKKKKKLSASGAALKRSFPGSNIMAIKGYGITRSYR